MRQAVESPYGNNRLFHNKPKILENTITDPEKATFSGLQALETGINGNDVDLDMTGKIIQELLKASCNIIKTKGNFCCREINVFIGHRLQLALGVIFYFCVVGILCCALLTKAELCKVYMQVFNRVQTFASQGLEPVSLLLGNLAECP